MDRIVLLIILSKCKRLFLFSLARVAVLYSGKDLSYDKGLNDKGLSYELVKSQ